MTEEAFNQLNPEMVEVENIKELNEVLLGPHQTRLPLSEEYGKLNHRMNAGREDNFVLTRVT
jgi:hypothetical protein